MKRKASLIRFILSSVVILILEVSFLSGLGNINFSPMCDYVSVSLPVPLSTYETVSLSTYGESPRGFLSTVERV